MRDDRAAALPAAWTKALSRSRNSFSHFNLVGVTGTPLRRNSLAKPSTKISSETPSRNEPNISTSSVRLRAEFSGETALVLFPSRRCATRFSSTMWIG
ncbi:hypothetical protein D9M71_687510 [compost metagenome]